MEKKICTKCGWVGDDHSALVGDCGTQWCPDCNYKHKELNEVFPMFETYAIRVERKLDKIIELLEGKSLSVSPIPYPKEYRCLKCNTTGFNQDGDDCDACVNGWVYDEND